MSDDYDDDVIMAVTQITSKKYKVSEPIIKSVQQKYTVRNFQCKIKINFS